MPGTKSNNRYAPRRAPTNNRFGTHRSNTPTMQWASGSAWYRSNGSPIGKSILGAGTVAESSCACKEMHVEIRFRLTEAALIYLVRFRLPMFPSLRSLSCVDVFLLARFRYPQYLRRILLAAPALLRLWVL
jgi:hypothetical protein